MKTQCSRVQIQLQMAGVHSASRGLTVTLVEGRNRQHQQQSERKLYPWKLMLLIGKECFTAHMSRDSVAFGIKVPLSL